MTAALCRRDTVWERVLPVMPLVSAAWAAFMLMACAHALSAVRRYSERYLQDGSVSFHGSARQRKCCLVSFIAVHTLCSQLVAQGWAAGAAGTSRGSWSQ